MPPNAELQSKNQQGQTLTEFALVLPVLLLILFAVGQLGIVFHNYVTITDAARAGARKAAVGRQFTDPGGTAVAAVRASASDLKQAALKATVTSNWQPGSDVTVSVTYPYKISLLGKVVKSGSLTATTTERVE